MPWSHSLHPASSVWNSLLLFTASLWILLRCCSLLQSVACTIANDGVLILLRTLPKSQCLHLPEKTNTLRNHHHRMQNCWVSGHRYSTIFLFSFAYLKSELVAIQTLTSLTQFKHIQTDHDSGSKASLIRLRPEGCRTWQGKIDR